MKVRNRRAALLSDYEVLSIMKDVDQKIKVAAQAAVVAEEKGSETGAVISAAKTGGKEEQQGGNDKYAALDRQEQIIWKSAVPPNLRQLQYNLYETLINTQRPCSHQNDAMIPAFLDAVSAWERGRIVVGIEQRLSNTPIDKERRLTKGERLMLINHAPTSLIELHTIVEEIEERFSIEEREDLLAIIAHTLPLDLEAMQASSEKAAAAEAVADGEGGTNLALLQDTSMTFADQERLDDDDMVDDMDELQNEGHGEGAVDDEIPDE